MIVIAQNLAPGVSITLVGDGHNWRFGSWSRQSGLSGELLPAPPPEAVARRFASQDDAIAYFWALRPVVPR